MKGLAAGSLLALIVALPAWAEPVGFRYEIMWGGFHAGDLAITRDESGPKTVTGMSIRTVGLFDRLLRLRFSAEGGSRGEAGAGLISEHYRTHFRNRSREQVLRVAYRPGDEAVILQDEVLATFAPPPDDDDPMPEVPPELRRNAMDPLTNVSILGQKAREALAGGPDRFRTTTFDGRRNYDFDVAVEGKSRVNIHGREYQTIRLRMILRPVAGFKQRFRKLWEGADYTVHLDPETLLPVRIETDSFTASTIINVVEPCRMAADKCGPQLSAAER